MVLTSLGERDEALAACRRARSRSRAVGNQRFEAASLVALAANLRSKRRCRRRARCLCSKPGRWCRPARLRRPLTLAEVAQNTSDPVEKVVYAGARRAAARARRRVAQRRWLRSGAIRLQLALGYHEVLRHADALDAYVRDEPFAWATHHASAARAWCAARGETGAALHADLRCATRRSPAASPSSAVRSRARSPACRTGGR